MGKFDWLPEEYRPMESEHVEHQCVYRATKSTDILKVEDFLPSVIENPYMLETFGKLVNKQELYGVSLFTDLDALKEMLKKKVSLDRKINSFSKGFTTITKGISTKANSHCHLEYYLYDYENNNPKDDFEIIEVR